MWISCRLEEETQTSSSPDDFPSFDFPVGFLLAAVRFQVSVGGGGLFGLL